METTTEDHDADVIWGDQQVKKRTDDIIINVRNGDELRKREFVKRRCVKQNMKNDLEELKITVLL